MSECCANGCTQVGEYTAVIILHARGHRPDEYEPARVELPYVFCHEHSTKLEAYDTLSEADWTRICVNFYRNHRVQPDRTNVGIEWFKLGEIETAVEPPPLPS